MWYRSFTLRITLLSTAISGTVLIAFGAWAWQLMYTTSLERIDREIAGIARRHLEIRHPPEHWEQVDESLRTIFGEEDGNPVMLRVQGRNGRLLHQSSNWVDVLYHGQVTNTDEPPEPREQEDYPPPPRDEWSPDSREHRPPLYGREPPVDERGAEREYRAEYGPGMQRPRGERRFAPPPREFDRRDAPRGGHRRPPRRGRFGPPSPPKPLDVRELQFVTRTVDGRDWRYGVMENPYVTMTLGMNLDTFQSDLRDMKRAFAGSFAVASLLIAFGGWLIARRALRPLNLLTHAAEGITAQGLDKRIPVTNEDTEFMRLIGVFNSMLDRLERGFNQAVRFSADSAHELKTPLTILQGELEQALHEAEPGSEQQRTFSKLLDEVQRLKSITRKLLLLSLADSGQLTVRGQPLNLSELVSGNVEDAEVLAPHLKLETSIAPDCWILGDDDLIRQVFQNLLNNAIKYNQKGGAIRMKLRIVDNTVRFTIANTGRGIPKEDRDKVFQRFYRADESRNRSVGGAGLGLSLSREIAYAHHGNLMLEDTPNGVTKFAATFPLAPKRLET